MRPNALKTLAALALAVLAAAPVFAHPEPTDAMVVNVPFAFVAGATRLPAGRYHVSRVAPASRGFFLRNAAGDGAAAVLTREGRRRQDAPDERAKLVFEVYAGERFLSEIWTDSGSAAMELTASPDAERLAKSGVRPDRLVVHARR
jgi:hypothetical protein